ncbi:MAG: hypothetical protein AAGH15_03070 [Myxococcota bacterium]
MVVPGDGDLGLRDAGPADEGTTDADAGLPELGEVRPGTRLRPLRWIPEDGTPAGESLIAVMSEGGTIPAEMITARILRDTALEGRRCSGGLPSRSPDCFPLAPRSVFAFTDPECAQPIAPETGCDDIFATGGGGVWRRGDPVPVADALYTTDARGETCVGPRDPEELRLPPEGIRYEPLGPGALVRLTEERREPAGGGAIEVLRTYGDGTIERHLEPAEPCRVWRTTEGSRCLPIDLPIVPQLGFAEGSCTVPAIARPGDPAFPVGTLAGSPDDAGTLRLFRAVERARRPRYRRTPEGACVTDGANAIYAVAEAADASEFPSLTETAVGTGRLRPLRFLDGEGRPWTVLRADVIRTMQPRTSGLFVLTDVAELRFEDTELGIACVPWATSAGTRCLPVWSFEGVLVVYRDEGCSDPVAVDFDDRPGAPPPLVLEVVLDGFQYCPAPPMVTVRPVLEPIAEAPELFILGAEGCVPMFTRARPSFQAYEAGDPIPLERFAAFRPDVEG